MKKDVRVYTGMLLFLLGVTACLYGAFCTSEADTVMQKAVTICLECIGIG